MLGLLELRPLLETPLVGLPLLGNPLPLLGPPLLGILLLGSLLPLLGKKRTDHYPRAQRLKQQRLITTPLGRPVWSLQKRLKLTLPAYPHRSETSHGWSYQRCQETRGLHAQLLLLLLPLLGRGVMVVWKQKG